VRADWDPDSPGPDSFCSGTLIAPEVFLTAAHCTASLEADGITGFQGSDGVRRYALQSALNLEKAWLLLSMNPSTGSGGTYYGDSGGPHFLGGVASNLIMSITITGDAMCQATDKTYRLDTEAAGEFLADFVALPPS
jgi:secreted trypsin-like serine protease